MGSARRPAMPAHAWCAPLRALLCAATVAAGCSGRPDGYGIHFTMLVDSSITDGSADSIRWLEIASLSSVEPFSAKLPAKDRFGGRKAEITYRPQVPGGTLAFVFRVRDEKDGLVGIAWPLVALTPGAIVDDSVLLVNPDSLPSDMGPRYDFTVIDLSMPDLTPPPPPPDMARMRDQTMPPPGDMSMPPPPADMSMPPPPADMSTPPPPDDLTPTGD